MLPALALVACATGTRSSVSSSRSGPAELCTADTIRLTISEATLVGSLACPATPTPVPLVLFLSGSGPTDRDGNTSRRPGRNDAVRMLADSLADRGIASVRYDKRGVGASGDTAAAERDMRFDVYVADAAAWVRMLQHDPRFSSVTIVGHSEGSLIGMIAAHEAGADAFVSVDGAGVPAGRILGTQLARQLSTPMLEAVEQVLRELEAGRTVDSLPAVFALAPALQRIFRPSLQPYLISWFRYDPVDALARLHVPVLIIQGTTDIQTSPDDARALAGARPGLSPTMIEGMNHVLKLVSPDATAQDRSYQDPTLPVPGRLVAEIATFVHDVPRR